MGKYQNFNFVRYRYDIFDVDRGLDDLEAATTARAR